VPITITLTDTLVAKLQEKAELQRLSVEEAALHILSTGLEIDEKYPTPEDVVARIQATLPHSVALQTPAHSLAEALRNAPIDPEFDLDTWQKEWDAVEAEMKALTETKNQSEGRG
jgi:hypothetical protein